jgi:predicted ATPase/class 3 adenylate cyclase
MMNDRTIVALLFADMEGSTRLLQSLGDDYDALLAGYMEVLESVVAAAGGEVVGTEGDGLFASFPAATAALAAAAEAQRALAARSWHGDVEVRARMGLHVGEVRPGPTGPVGIAIHEAARLAAAGHGGQVLISGEMRQVLGDDIGPGLSLRDLGEHRFKDLSRPERVFQIDIEGLPGDFPPIRSVDGRRHNLPEELTSFVGREAELTEVTRQLAKHRLVTLVGPGGAGKTRLALHVGRAVLDEYAGGVWIAELAALTEPGQVAPAVAKAVGIREKRATSAIDDVLVEIAASELLLLLDNCEHLVDAAADLAASILRIAPAARILATSREPLEVSGEAAYRVPALEMPAVDIDPRGITAAASVRLFLDRAAAATPGRRIEGADLAAIAEICRRLDGMPLALELAAARLRVLSPSQLAERLVDALGALGSAGRTAPSRQRTLKATLDWSHDLLSPREQVMLRRSSVFAGGFTLEAAEAVCGTDPLAAGEVVDLIARLVATSLLNVIDSDPPRYRMAESTRQYAMERLGAETEADKVRRRHAEFFRSVVAGDGSDLTQLEQALFLATLEADHDNLGSALRWSVDRGETDLALGLAGNLVHFWYRRGYFGEAKGWLTSVLDMAAAEPTPELANVTRFAAVMALDEGDPEKAVDLIDRAESIARQLDAPGLMARAVNLRAGFAWRLGDLDSAAAHYREAVAQLAGTTDSFTPRLLTNLAEVLIDSGRFADATAVSSELDGWLAEANATTVDAIRVRAGLAFGRGELDDAARDAAEAVSRYRDLELAPHLGMALKLFADIERCRGDAVAAGTAAQEAVELFTKIDDAFNAAEASLIIADLHLEAGDVEAATPLLHDALALFLKTDRRLPLGLAVEESARAASLHQDWQRSSMLYGAASVLLQAVIERPLPRERALERQRSAVRRALGAASYDALFKEGAALSPSEAAELALAAAP